MVLGNILEFRKDLYFEGAVQADWFYQPEKAATVAENFVFHGNEYYGVENTGLGSKARIDTISLVERILHKLSDENENALTLAIADYGTGKSHLAVTLGQILSGSEYMPDTYSKIISNISKIDKYAVDRIQELNTGRNFVMVINGMRDFNLHSEILKAAQKSLMLYGLPDDKLKKLNRALETAEIFFERNKSSLLSNFEKTAGEKGWTETGEKLINKIANQLMVDEECFEIVNGVYAEVNGQEIHWDEGISASAILELLVSEYCGMNGMFDHIVILFDEFGRYLEYASGVNPAKSGNSALQQIFEMTQNADGALHIINFIQSDIKTYLQRVDLTTNISRYIGRYDASDKYYISSNLETVFANLIQRKDVDAFNDLIVKWQNQEEVHWKEQFELLNRWLNTKGMWRDYSLYRKVVVEGIYPMHPFATFMLTQLSDYLQNRSSLTLISQYITQYSNVEIKDKPFIILPETLMLGDLYVEMLAAEQEGKQQSQQCIRYANVLSKFGDKLSDNSLKVLRSNLIVRILRFNTNSYEDAKLAISLCSGMTISEVEQELVWLENEYAVLGFDERSNRFDFMEESNGAHDFKVLKKRLMSQNNISISYLSNLKIRDLAEVNEVQTTNFATKHKITTADWVYHQEMYPVEELTNSRINSYIEQCKESIDAVSPKGQLIWLYLNKDTDVETIENIKKLICKCEHLPIIFMLLNDTDNRLFHLLLEYKVLDEMEIDIRTKYQRHYDDDFSQVERNIRDEFERLKKERNRLTMEGVQVINSRMPSFLTDVFEMLYPNVISFQFDGFVTKNGNIAPKASGNYCSILKMLLTNSINENSIHSFGVEVRNRFEAILMTTSNTSWKCVDNSYRVVPPEEKKSRQVFDLIANKVKEEKEYKCSDLFALFCSAPYGISRQAVLLILAVVCAQLNYCLRFRYGGAIKTINNWKTEAIDEKNKIKWNYILESSLVYVDADAVSGKFSRFFDKVNSNKDIFQVNALYRELTEMEAADEVPDMLLTARDLAIKTLDSGKKARAAWDRHTSNLEDKYNQGIDDYNKRAEIYSVVDALVDLQKFPLAEIFDENGYCVTDEVKQKLANIRKALTSFLDKTGEVYVSHMACTEIARLNTFKNHNMKLISKLKEVGYDELAKKVEEKKNAELENTAEIISRQELKTDLEKYLNESEVTRYTTYIQIQGYIKKGNQLEIRYGKYGAALGNLGKQLHEDLQLRLKKLIELEETTRNEMLAIWDMLDELSDEQEIKAVLAKIQLVKQKGISKTDLDSFVEIETTLEDILIDIKTIKEAGQERNSFIAVTSSIISKYDEKEFDFEVKDIISSIVQSVEVTMNKKEIEWKEKYLMMKEKSRENIYRWKDATKVLPGFLSERTLEEYNALAEEYELIISESRIDDVLYQFAKLSSKEKEECIKKLQTLI